MIFVYSIPPGAAATHTATSLTHTPWSTRLGLARSQHGENRMRLRIRGIDPRNGIGESDGRGDPSVLVKIKTIQRSMRVLPMRGSSGPSNRHGVMTIDRKAVRTIQGRK